ncbi:MULTISPECIES: DUF1501 domain-containing protein [unclassified Undibacterium]|uniref:DUF1501 domain-containing protein n=1 Tax=unclassified Undibacterium TaxID=2630295 RepID=UPI002AC8F996|nr:MULTISPECIES: DUF1501 domain-containing protein [unclassified Undibacterium]MEB0140602.1 DUF1501 domain-containing protein [Undibacterium sp. CCC2.1]MEB0173492.1 DUF1501 domain-containing protein [Undibacterium sp. CCC1.1]MEB0177606.1 DUF1501 domain-containing protein [Undibacterium sp. CCC3.4]MEB0216780.1 DUF1501 domain-containing protein [Undibacterium sp. 5I2]WPX44670.1 DUF1501 domain-containing protein [Undibacterium sp. CCC3.4]
MNRRLALSRLLALSALSPLTWSGSVMAAPASEQKLLLVFLRGGYDACHLLVPTASNYYYESRPNIAIARPGPDPRAALPLTADWGLHPALRNSLYPWFGSGELAFIPFAGTDDLSRSHFETQDSIELGQPLSGRRDFHSGFMNRLAAVLNENKNVPTMAFTDQLPLAMQGSARVGNTSLKNLSKVQMEPRQSQIIEQMYRKTTLAQPVQEGFSVRQDIATEMQQEMGAASRAAISSKGFALEAQRVAKLMRDKYPLGFIDVGGWDTHVDQGGAQGMLANKFEEFGRGLAAYREEMGAAWRDTTVVVISEFGRTFRENGKRGTDHGHGSVYWVLGGAVRGGKIAGEQIALTPGQLFQNRDYPVLNEYRAVLAGLFARLYGLNEQQLSRVFDNVKARDLALL